MALSTPEEVQDPRARAQAAALEYVSRSALKLAGALDDLASSPRSETNRGGTQAAPSTVRTVPVRGRRALDVGASTGGFTQVLLERGAHKVIALDVGHGQLHEQIASDDRVLDLQGCNARDLAPGDLPWTPDLVVGDVSFVSWSVLLPALVSVAPRADFVLMVKPQFEVGRDRLPKDGVVRDPAEQRRAIDAVIVAAAQQGLELLAQAPSRLPGTHGNLEHFLWLRSEHS